MITITATSTREAYSGRESRMLCHPEVIIWYSSKSKTSGIQYQDPRSTRDNRRPQARPSICLAIQRKGLSGVMMGIAPVRLQPRTLITLVRSHSPWSLPGISPCPNRIHCFYYNCTACRPWALYFQYPWIPYQYRPVRVVFLSGQVDKVLGIRAVRLTSLYLLIFLALEFIRYRIPYTCNHDVKSELSFNWLYSLQWYQLQWSWCT